jgi:hypothetical protein
MTINRKVTSEPIRKGLLLRERTTYEKSRPRDLGEAREALRMYLEDFARETDPKRCMEAYRTFAEKGRTHHGWSGQLRSYGTVDANGLFTSIERTVKGKLKLRKRETSGIYSLASYLQEYRSNEPEAFLAGIEECAENALRALSTRSGEHATYFCMLTVEKYWQYILIFKFEDEIVKARENLSKLAEGRKLGVPAKKTKAVKRHQEWQAKAIAVWALHPKWKRNRVAKEIASNDRKLADSLRHIIVKPPEISVRTTKKK